MMRSFDDDLGLEEAVAEHVEEGGPGLDENSTFKEIEQALRELSEDSER